ERATVLAHGLLAEALTRCEVFQTIDAAGQELERQIKRVWSEYDENPAAHVDSPWLRTRLKEIMQELAVLETSYDDWQILYRESLQLARALSGQRQLLAQTYEGSMDNR